MIDHTNVLNEIKYVLRYIIICFAVCLYNELFMNELLHLTT